MRIKQKLILLLLLIGLLPTLLVSIFSYISINKQLTQKTLDQLASIAIKQQQRLNSILQKNEEDSTKLVLSYELQNDLTQQAISPNIKQDTLTSYLRTVKINSPNMRDLHLTDTTGKVIASTVSGLYGKKLDPTEYVVPSDEQNTISLQEDPRDGINKLYIASKIIIDHKEVGVLVIAYTLEDIVATVHDYTGLGDTGETVIAKKTAGTNAISLFALRFDNNAASQTKLTSLRLFPLDETIYPDLVDYRGKQVMVAKQHIDKPSWAMATKIDRDEALAPIVALRNVIIAIFIVSSIIIVAIALNFANYFTLPILTLTEKSRLIMQGDFSQHVTITSTDEIGTLGTTFNQMTSTLKQNIAQLRDERIKLEASINSLSVGYIMVDRDNNIVTINHTARQTFCASPTSPLTTIKECTLAHIEDELKEVFDLKKLIAQCFAEKRALMLREVTFNNRYFKIVITPIITIGVIGAVILIDDITEAKILERSKDEFFSIASHELRTPLTAIRGNASMIQDFYGDKIKDPVELSEMVADIHDSSIRLIGIVNDFLDMSRLEQSKMEFIKAPIDLVEIINSVIKEYQIIVSQKKLTLVFQPPMNGQLPKVYADAGKTKQILINLISNALKFTEQGGITITTEVLDRFIKILVTDTGQGISSTNQNLLFRKFQQANTSLLTRDTTKGTGLGLYISKLMAQGMGGAIKLEQSIEGKGTIFSLSLPIATKEQLGSQQSSTSTTKTDTITGLTKNS